MTIYFVDFASFFIHAKQMNFLSYPAAEAITFGSSNVHCVPKFANKFSFSAELCGIWLGDLPSNQHLEATILPAHFFRGSLTSSGLPMCTSRPPLNELTKPPLPQKSSKKNSVFFGQGTRLTSTVSLQKSDFFDLTDDATIRLGSGSRMQLEACRITGFITCSNGSLVFSSSELNLKIPAFLGGPGDMELLSSPQHCSNYGFTLPCNRLNSGTLFDLPYWTMENVADFSSQSLFSPQPGCFSTGRKPWSNVTSPLNLRKRGVKQLWSTLMSKTSKHNRQSADSEAPTVTNLSASPQPPESAIETLRLEWPLTTLRQFAFHGCFFKMETGRRAPHGEGHYLFRISDITEFRQNLEAYIDHQKRSRTLKTRSAVCCPSISRSSPPSIPPPPPPITTARAYANIPSILSPALNRSWASLLPVADELTDQEKTDQCYIRCDMSDTDCLGLPTPPPPSSAPPLTHTIESFSEMHHPLSLPRVGTYENVRSFLRSRGTMTAPPTSTHTLNYAMLEFQNPPDNTSGLPVPCHPSVGSSSCEILPRIAPPLTSPMRLARSMETRLNAMHGEEEVDRLKNEALAGICANYVDICPLQTVAINELLRGTL